MDAPWRRSTMKSQINYIQMTRSGLRFFQPVCRAAPWFFLWCLINKCCVILQTFKESDQTAEVIFFHENAIRKISGTGLVKKYPLCLVDVSMSFMYLFLSKKFWEDKRFIGNNNVNAHVNKYFILWKYQIGINKTA